MNDSTPSTMIVGEESSNPDGVGIAGESVISSLRLGDDETRDLVDDASCVFDRKPKLNLQNMALTGRGKEYTLLEAGYRRIQTGKYPSEVILIDGSSGTGKSALAESLREPVSLQRHGFFVSGKFDQLRNEPFVALVEAFTDLCDLVSQDKTTCQEIAKKLEGDISVLSKVIPNLSTVTGTEQCNDGISASFHQAQSSFTQLKLACRRFLTAVASEKHPIVLLIDDLQWADKESLEVIQAIITDVNSKYILLIGTFRSGDARSLKGLLNMVENEDEKCLRCTSIHLDGFDCDQVASLIANCTNSKPSETCELASLVVKRTNGNPLCVMRFIEMLEYDQLLSFDANSEKWVWSADRIREETIACDNVVEIVKARIKGLTSGSQSVLRLAAVLGFTFDTEVIKAAAILKRRAASHQSVSIEQVAAQVDAALKVTEDRGLIERNACGTFRFCHDSVSDCLYSMTPKGIKLASVHLLLANAMQELGDSNELHTFSIADQLNRAKMLINAENDRVNSADCNLRAAKQALGQSAFDMALEYAQHGLDAVDNSTKWDLSNYTTVLDLHCVAAEALYCCGNLEESNRHLQQVFQNATSPADTTRARIIHVYALGAHARLEEAIDVAFCGARELGVKLPKRPAMHHAIFRLIKTKAMLRGKSDEQLLAAPTVGDEGMVEAVHFVAMAAHYASVSMRIPHLILAIATLMQLSVKGKCSRSSSFCTFGILETAMGNIEQAVRMAHLTSKMHEIQDDKHNLPADFCVMHTFLLHWRAPLHDSLEPLQRAYVNSKESGENDVAFLATSTWIQLAVVCGYLPLDRVERRTREYVGQMYEFNHVSQRYLSLPYWQLCLNLMGQSDHPSVLTGDAMDEESFAADATNAKVLLAPKTLDVLRIVLGCHFEISSHVLYGLMIVYEAMEQPPVGHFMKYITKFYVGLSYIQLYRSFAKRSDKRKASKIANELKKLTLDDCPNTKPLWALMDAELATLAAPKKQQDSERVATLFLDAIQEASGMQNMCVEAMANERAARYHQTGASSSNNNEHDALARQYMSRAVELYENYGALAKVEFLQRSSRLLHNKTKRQSRRRHPPEIECPL